MLSIALALGLNLVSAQDQVLPVEPPEAPPALEAGAAVDETPSLWFVELASPPAAEGTSIRQLRAEKTAFRAAARAAGLSYTERYAFDTLWNGLSVRINRVPFAGFVGDYQGIQVLTSAGYEFPWLSVFYSGSFYRITDPTDWTFTMQGDDVPFVLVHLDHQCRRLRLEVFASPSGRAWHRAYDEEYMPRNSTSTGFFALPFDGYTINGRKLNQVPDGQYYLRLSVLKALGQDTNPAHWETWMSPIFVIDRP